MDITLIPQAESIYNKKLNKNIISDSGITQLSDCALILMHKAGLRPLYVVGYNKTNIQIEPDHKTAKPNYIVCENDEIAKQSAGVIQNQLEHNGCSVNIGYIGLSKSKNTNIQKNLLETRLKQMEEKGVCHLVIVGKKEQLDKIARCICGQGLNSAYNIPIYSYSNGVEITDKNLMGGNMYVTRDILDSMLIHQIQFDENPKLEKYKNLCHKALELPHLKRKLNINEHNK